MCVCEDEIIKIILRPFFQILFRQLAAVVVAVAVVVVVAAVVVIVLLYLKLENFLSIVGNVKVVENEFAQKLKKKMFFANERHNKNIFRIASLELFLSTLDSNICHHSLRELL